MDLKLNLTAAALAALALGGCSSAPKAEKTPAAAVDAGKKGECHGVNACKGQGACGGAESECAGTNACKGHGWLSLTKAECDGKSGKFKGS